MIKEEISNYITELAKEYNSIKYFNNDPVIFPRYFYGLFKEGKASLQDVEISGILCAHLAWGRRELIIRDCKRVLDEMRWRPFEYVMCGKYRDDAVSIHRTIKWRDISFICNNLKEFYTQNPTMEVLLPEEIREIIFKSKPNKKAANKKIHMFRRWMVRDDNIVDIGIWKNIAPSSLIIPLDVHVHRNALKLGLTNRKTPDIVTAKEITKNLNTIFPGDPVLGDFALFAATASNNKKIV